MNKKEKIDVFQFLDQNGCYTCPWCMKSYSKMGIATHVQRKHLDGTNFDPNIGYESGRMAWNKGKTFLDDTRTLRFDMESVRNDKSVKRYLILERGCSCESCDNSEQMGQPIKLELHHIDGNSDNRDRANLKLLCPNCHSMTPTYKGANKGNGKRQMTRRQRFADGKTF